MPSQFGAPQGPRGWLAAQVVARLTGDANRWMVDCLDVDRDDRVLDVGCGPGLAVAAAAELALDGWVVGVDVSPTMVRQARRRNRSAADQGRVEIRQADAARLPYPDATFTKVGSLNSLQFWPDPDQGLRELFRVLRPGGRVAVVLMARSDEPTGLRSGTPPWLEETVDRMGAVGFDAVDIASRTFGGVLHRAIKGDRKSGKKVAPHSTPRRTG